MAEEKVIEVFEATKQFGTLTALAEVSFELYRGEVLSILGPNGAGKTTLINALLGKASLTAGKVTLFQNKPGEIAVKRKIGAMLQIADLPEQLTVKEHIQLFQSYYPQPLNYSQVISLAGLEKIEKRRSKKLSGGEKQRLLFGLAICGNPEVVFLDEPTVGMDVQARKQIWQAISWLKESNKSVILTTHYLEEADQLSDRIVMLNHGRVIHQGSPEVIKSKTQSKKIICETNLPIEQLCKLDGVLQVEQYGRVVHLNTQDPVNSLRDLFKQTNDIANLEVRGTALEDAFVALNQDHESNLELMAQ